MKLTITTSQLKVEFEQDVKDPLTYEEYTKKLILILESLLKTIK